LIVENNIIVPTPAHEFDTIKTYENGTITDISVESKIVAISGGALNEIGPITATEIASNGTNGWIFVGGSDGLAILSNPDGTGWNIGANQLANKFDGLTNGMSFKKIGNYRFVKKLIYDGDFLFVITNDLIDRINLTTTDFSSEKLDSVTIATKESLKIISNNGAILDAIVSQAFAIIATTGGLLRIEDDQDIRTVTNQIESNWIPIAIPEIAGAPTQLLSVTTTGREQDITRTIGGQLYVLTSSTGFDQSRINRFAITSLENDQPMQKETIEQFDDLFVENIPSFFINFGDFNSIFATDGALYFASRSKNNIQPPRTVLTPAHPAPQVAARNVGERSLTVAIPLQNGTEINALQRSQASGSWVIAGDFGMQVLE